MRYSGHHFSRLMRAGSLHSHPERPAYLKRESRKVALNGEWNGASPILNGVNPEQSDLDRAGDSLGNNSNGGLQGKTGGIKERGLEAAVLTRVYGLHTVVQLHTLNQSGSGGQLLYCTDVFAM
ncbi:hypothetical protein V8D89_014768 [Ganoderma adspersum]